MMIRLLTALSVAAGLCSAAAAAPIRAPSPAQAPRQAQADIDRAANQLRVALLQEVPDAIIDMPEEGRAWTARAMAVLRAGGYKIDFPQMIVVVDRNPAVQQLRIIMAQPDGPWFDVGGSRVSTGERGRRDYFLTPTGVFPHTAKILDWRAEGTFNEHHIRGLGLAGMRVWDFGWQETTRGWGPPVKRRIRLLLHATDPRYLETRLGRTTSEGCVRIPTEMNLFLDRHGVLDRDYRRAAASNRRFAALLAPDTSPTPLAGDKMVVLDSSGQNPTAEAASDQDQHPSTQARPHRSTRLRVAYHAKRRRMR